MTRFFNIVFIVCLAAVFYMRSESPETAVAPVQAAKASDGADAKLASLKEDPVVKASTKAPAETSEITAAAKAAVAKSEHVVSHEIDAAQTRSGNLRYIMASNPTATPFTVLAASWQADATRAVPAVMKAVAAAPAPTAAKAKPATAPAPAQDASRVTEVPAVEVKETVKAEPAAVTEPEAVPTRLYAVSGNVVNARSGPGTGNAVLAQLKRGAVVEDTGERDGNWSQVVVKDSGLKVWMHRDFLNELS
ncbi:SH3 domain-containing protein [Neptunicoccus sediminis]|uniref:SH3 domain-containing protein n=1 Tax=Neptunicoccus sediminis TaxID=1892596 RepID=UPI000846116C|nr:SH3 domain-containing protein [Neptunicoccus sediminis]